MNRSKIKTNGSFLISLFFCLSVLFACSCSKSDSSTSPTNADNASVLAGKYRMTAAYSSDKGWVSIPDGSSAYVYAKRTGTNTLTLTMEINGNSSDFPNITATNTDGKYVLNCIYSDGYLYGQYANSLLEVAVVLTSGKSIEFKAKRM